MFYCKDIIISNIIIMNTIPLVAGTRTLAACIEKCSTAFITFWFNHLKFYFVGFHI